jgi:DNA repair exonuclease SbcCD ATPase subunit
VISPTLPTLNLVVDFGLMITVGLFVYKCLKVPDALKHNRRLNELEATLQSLIREASVAGDMLNQELQDRRNELEKVLMEVEKMVAKLNRLRELCETTNSELKNTAELVRQDSSELQAQLCNSQESIRNLEELNQMTLNNSVPLPPKFNKAVKIKKKQPTKLSAQIKKEIVLKDSEVKKREKNGIKAPQFEYITIKT